MGFSRQENTPVGSQYSNTGVGSHSLLRESSQPRNRAWVSGIARKFFTIWATRKAQLYTQTLKLSIQKTKIMASGCITSWQIDGETVETVGDFIWGGSKITADGDCSHDIKRRLLLGRKVITNLDSIWKSKDVTLPTKVHLVKAMVFPVVRYGRESWTVKKAEHRRTDAFELWCWRRLLRVSWTARRSKQSILKEISPECSLKGLMLKLKLQYFGLKSTAVKKTKPHKTVGKQWRSKIQSNNSGGI